MGLRRLFCIEPIPSSVGVDLFVYRTRGEIPYVQALVSIPLATIEGWRGVTGVRQAAICFAKPLLRIEFRFLSKRSEYWLEQVADERYDRSLWNLAVPFQCPQARQMTRDARRRGFCRFPEAWQRYEVAQGCTPELPTVVSYKTSQLMRRDSGWWVVVYTEHACKTAAYLLMDVYDSLRLWWIPTALIEAIRALDLVEVLGNQANVHELNQLLQVIESTDFTMVDSQNSLRYANTGFCPGRTAPGGDFIYYDPWTRTKLSKSQYEAMRTRGRSRWS